MTKGLLEGIQPQNSAMYLFIRRQSYETENSHTRTIVSGHHVTHPLCICLCGQAERTVAAARYQKIVVRVIVIVLRVLG